MVKLLLGVGAGATIGWLYHHFIGCRSGTCPITANAWSSVLYGAVMGFMLAR